MIRPWLTNEGGRGGHAEKADLFLEIVAHVLAAMVVTKGEAGGNGAPKRPKCSRTPCRSGSSASNRVARFTAWMPTHSAVQ